MSMPRYGSCGIQWEAAYMYAEGAHVRCSTLKDKHDQCTDYRAADLTEQMKAAIGNC